MFQNTHPPLTPTESALESRHFTRVIRAFQSYRAHSLAAMAKRRRDLASLGDDHRAILSGLEEKIGGAEEGVRRNGVVMEEVARGYGYGAVEDEDEVAEVGEKTRGGEHDQSHEHSHSSHSTEQDMDKVRSTIRQFYRDWSTEGAEERRTSYGPILEAIEGRYKGLQVEERGAVRVLVPGAGLGRLAYEVVRRGFTCQGNEFSFYMLLGSHFILNHTTHTRQHTIYPWIHSFSNHLTSHSLLTPISIPDVLPGSIPPTADFSMVAGDFTEVYGVGAEEQRGAWDVVATCFFLDTAKNVVEYVDAVSWCLGEGGVWVNLGPLLFHWEGMPNEVSIELTWEELKAVILARGFRITEERTLHTTYASNPTGMLTYNYEVVFFVAEKMAKE
ncbi:N2227-domain-containing protein [Fimicolochytrium jonesii]|uniref:N2227-domain-containing protein n=1 Tax=Fimicolochytrium jonesii TaxID=1396493 RepID=UPI0022FE9533|nr:N2227-domain-containing protein [Fimicolochytrium jonesii]KAI8816624.1 N2227-domain-containing protein [Fimicolochytrium jonesii]